MKAVILAGGKSTRLRPLTWELPKPMVPVMNVPVMDTILHLLQRHGILDICATLMFMPQKIQDRYGDGSGFGIHLTYSMESRPLGTAGCVKATGNFPDSTIVVISGDCITDFDLGAAIRFHREHHAEATLLMTRVDVPIDYGVLLTDADCNITGFQEKPGWDEVFTNQVNTGIYILEPSILDLIPVDEPYDFARDLFPELLRQNRKICGHDAAGNWSDISSFDSYVKTHCEILEGRMEMHLPGSEPSPGIHVGLNTIIDPYADIDSSVIFPEHHANMIFGQNGLSGIINVDITPEFASCLGAAYGTRLGRRGTAAVSWDGCPPARLFRYAFIAGLMKHHVARIEWMIDSP